MISLHSKTYKTHLWEDCKLHCIESGVHFRPFVSGFVLDSVVLHPTQNPSVLSAACISAAGQSSGVSRWLQSVPGQQEEAF